jgi:hypothetical protein
MELAIQDVLRREGKTFDPDKHLRELLDKDMSHPVNGRRLWWFALAMLVRRLDKITAKDQSLVAAASQVWSALISGAQYVSGVIGTQCRMENRREKVHSRKHVERWSISAEFARCDTFCVSIDASKELQGDSSY